MLINCVLYQDGKKVRDLNSSEVQAAMKLSGAFVWMAFWDPDIDEILQMQSIFNLHPLAIEDVRNGNQRPKVEEYGDVLFTILRVPNLEDEKNQNLGQEFGEVDLFVGPNFVLSIRKGVAPGFVKVRERCEKEPYLLALGSGFVFYAIIDNIVDRYYPFVEKLETDLESIEENIFKGRTSRRDLEDLYLLKQRTIAVKHLVSSTLDMVGKLYGGRVPKVCMGVQEYFRDVFDHLYRMEQSIESMREILATAMQVNLNLITIAESEVTKKLGAWAALVAVPTMIAGIYGMNFKHMPELDSPMAYPICLLVMFLLDLTLFFRFRKAQWI